jgi:tRNA U34 2-thiouridine synthase MnmA/TrmU
MKCIVMFSGGLDSTIAVHMMQRQGLDVLALNFVLPFYSGLGLAHQAIKNRASSLNVPLRIEEEGEEYLAMFKARSFGFGKNVNPCLDCRIHRLVKAAVIMKEVGASFIATGEVVGQRPMSQRRECLDIIDKRTGLRGLILRPLSAKILRSTVPEERGWVKREELLDFSGRGRKGQIAYAKQFNLSYPNPAGGCLLTNSRTAERYNDLAQNDPDFSLNDFKLLAYGRHFRLGPSLRLIMARDDSENEAIAALALPGDRFIVLKDIAGPVGIIRGQADETHIRTACSIFTKYTRARTLDSAGVEIAFNGETSVCEVVPASDEECEEIRV